MPCLIPIKTLTKNRKITFLDLTPHSRTIVSNGKIYLPTLQSAMLCECPLTSVLY